MALNISAWAIRNPLPPVVFSIILLVLGWVSFTKLAVTRLPSADIPVISVAVAQFGAAPAELESQVTKTIEDGVSGVEGVRHISSSITDGLTVTTIQFALETNTDRALNDVKDAVTRVRSNLPQNVNEPLIQRVDVVTGGASASWGSDAIAGVVNFITDKKYTGFKANISSGLSTYGDNATMNAQIAAGTSFAGGRGHF